MSIKYLSDNPSKHNQNKTHQKYNKNITHQNTTKINPMETQPIYNPSKRNKKKKYKLSIVLRYTQWHIKPGQSHHMPPADWELAITFTLIHVKVHWHKKPSPSTELVGKKAQNASDNLSGNRIRYQPSRDWLFSSIKGVIGFFFNLQSQVDYCSFSV